MSKFRWSWLRGYFFNGFKYWHKQVSVIIGAFVLDDWDESFEAHSRVHVLVRQGFQWTIGFPLLFEFIFIKFFLDKKNLWIFTCYIEWTQYSKFPKHLDHLCWPNWPRFCRRLFCRSEFQCMDHMDRFHPVIIVEFLFIQFVNLKNFYRYLPFPKSYLSYYLW